MFMRGEFNFQQIHVSHAELKITLRQLKILTNLEKINIESSYGAATVINITQGDDGMT